MRGRSASRGRPLDDTVCTLHPANMDHMERSQQARLDQDIAEASQAGQSEWTGHSADNIAETAASARSDSIPSLFREGSSRSESNSSHSLPGWSHRAIHCSRSSHACMSGESSDSGKTTTDQPLSAKYPTADLSAATGSGPTRGRRPGCAWWRAVEQLYLQESRRSQPREFHLAFSSSGRALLYLSAWHGWS